MTRKRSFQLGTVELHHNKWTVRYSEKTATGWKTRRESLTSTTRGEARIEANDVMTRVRAHEVPTSSGLTFKEFIDTVWQSHIAHAKLREKTIEAYSCTIRIHLIPFFGPRRLKDITKAHCAEFFDQPSLQKYRPTSTMMMYGVLRRVLSLAQDFDFIDRLPLVPRLHRPHRGSPDKVILTADQIRMVMQKAPSGRTLLALAATTGARIGEILGFQWQDVDWEEGTIKIVRQAVNGKLTPLKTKASIRTLRLAESMLIMLKAHRAVSAYQAQDSLIFPARRGRPLHAAAVGRSVLRPALEAAGIPREKQKHGWHIFRHSYGTALYDATKDVKLVQALLGHASIGITMDTYVHHSAVSEGADFSATLLSDYVN